MPVLLGLDVGTTNVKLVAWDLKGSPVAARVVRAELVTSQPDQAVRDLPGLWSRVAAALRDINVRLRELGESVAGAGLTGHGNGLYLWDGQGFAPEAIGSSDRRCALALARAPWRAEIELQVGQSLYPGQTLVLLRTHLPAGVGAGYGLFAKDWLGFQLTGILCSDPTDMHAGALINLAGRELMPRVAEVRPSTALRGSVTKKAQAETGVPAGTPVGVGCIDLAASAVGCGRLGAGQRVALAGSWAIDLALREGGHRPQVGGRVNTLRSALPGIWMECLYAPAGALLLDKVLGELGMALDFGVVDARVQSARPHPGLVVTPDLGCGLPEMTRYTPDEVLYAVYEGIAALHRYHFEILDSPGWAPERARGSLALAGGMAASPVWSRLLADLLGEEIENFGEVEAASRGAAMCAGVAAGVFGSLAEAAEVMVAPGPRLRPDFARQAAAERRFALWRRARQRRSLEQKRE